MALDVEKINEALALRQSGYGRGARQKIERDAVEILTGVRNGETLGSPVALCIYNRDYENWKSSMSAGACDEAAMQKKALTKVRPGHADLTGMLKFAQNDARNILERASARETAIRVAACEVYRQYLAMLGVEIGGLVREVCGIKDDGEYTFEELKKTTPVGMLDERASELAQKKIDELKKAGDTAGGVVEIRVRGLKSGFGNVMTYAEKLDSQIAAGIMSIQAAKGVEIGAGFAVAQTSGKDIHDEIFYDETKGFYRNTNRAGGIEGGMSNGEEIVIRVAMKPIPTLMKGLQTVDFTTKEAATAASERSDVCAIFAFKVIAESVVAQVLADAVQKRLGGDTMAQVQARYNDLP